jgi:catechol 2,3-dioxygenase-like lactoylglutathione lyase family enzyme
MIKGFFHSGLVVKDMDKMVAFYRDALGLSVLREAHSKAPPEGDHTGIPGAERILVFVGFPDGGHQIELVKYIDPPSPEGHLDKHQLGASHICFYVDDTDAIYKSLSAQGVHFVTPPIIRDNADGSHGGIVYFQDPEGNYLELIQG